MIGALHAAQGSPHMVAAAEGLGWEVTVLPEPTLAGVALGPV